jgi:hypothetical protein
LYVVVRYIARCHDVYIRLVATDEHPLWTEGPELHNLPRHIGPQGEQPAPKAKGKAKGKAKAKGKSKAKAAAEMQPPSPASSKDEQSRLPKRKAAAKAKVCTPEFETPPPKVACRCALFMQIAHHLHIVTMIVLMEVQPDTSLSNSVRTSHLRPLP